MKGSGRSAFEVIVQSTPAALFENGAGPAETRILHRDRTDFPLPELVSDRSEALQALGLRRDDLSAPADAWQENP